MEITPFRNYVVIEAEPRTQKTKSGFILPQDEIGQPQPTKGTVVAVGDGEHVPENLKAGQKVVFKSYATDEVDIDGKKLFILAANDVMAFIA